jgi:ATP-dependent DNA helicase RecQ
VDIIERASLKPVVACFHRGGSLCYQLATFAQPGFTLIVAPLAALMQDQQDNLRAFGIHRTTAIPNAMLMREEDDEEPLRQSAIEAGEHLFVFVAPGLDPDSAITSRRSRGSVTFCATI